MRVKRKQGNSHQNARTRLAHAERTVQVRSSENGVQVRTDDNGVQVNESKKETTWEWSALSSIEGTVFDQLDPMPVQAIDIRAIQALFKKKEGRRIQHHQITRHSYAFSSLTAYGNSRFLWNN